MRARVLAYFKSVTRQEAASRHAARLRHALRSRASGKQFCTAQRSVHECQRGQILARSDQTRGNPRVVSRIAKCAAPARTHTVRNFYQVRIGARSPVVSKSLHKTFGNGFVRNQISSFGLLQAFLEFRHEHQAFNDLVERGIFWQAFQRLEPGITGVGLVRAFRFLPSLGPVQNSQTTA